MSVRSLTFRSLHDLGLGAWFGGSLMGAVGLNGAAAQARNPAERLRVSSIGWVFWTPWQVAAIGAHAIGGVAVIIDNRRRLTRQHGATAITVAKLLVTAAAAGTTAWSGWVGVVVARHADQGTDGVTEPSADADPRLASAQRQLKLLQWATPVLTAAAIVLGAAHGEQQRGISGLLDPAANRVQGGIRRVLSAVN